MEFNLKFQVFKHNFIIYFCWVDGANPYHNNGGLFYRYFSSSRVHLVCFVTSVIPDPTIKASLGYCPVENDHYIPSSASLNPSFMTPKSSSGFVTI